MSVLRGCTVALLALSTVFQPAPAFGGTTMAYLSGSRSGVVNLDLDHAVGWPLSTTLHTEASYAGFVVQNAHTSRVVEFFMYGSAVNFGDQPQLYPVVYTPRLLPGAYRITLLTDGPSEIGLSTRGLSGRFRPEHTAIAHVVMKRADVAPAVPFARVSLPIAVAPHEIVAVIGAEEAADSQASFVQLCLTHGFGCPLSSVDPVVSIGCLGCVTGDEEQLVYFAGQETGRHNAVMTAAAAGVQKLAGLLVVQIRQS